MIAIGVDTHKDGHTAVAVDHLGQLHGQTEIAASTSGYREFLGWALSLDCQPRFGIESTGSYGAGLCRYLQGEGHSVYEVQAPPRKSRRRGKSDTKDALLAAKALLAGEGISLPRTSGIREQLRIVVLGHDAAVAARTATTNQIQALIVAGPASLRERIGAARGKKLEQRLIRMRQTQTMSDLDRTALTVMRNLALQTRQLDKQAESYKQTLTDLVTKTNPTLLKQFGVGPLSAAKLLISSPERFKNEASFAATNGTAPIPASSGKTQRHRLNRGGDRQLNYAIHMIALSRAQHHPETQTYLQRKTSEGKTKKEAMRALKRQLSKRLFKILQPTPLTP